MAGVPVSELLGGKVRDSVQYSAYLFYKWGGHPGEPDDEYGPALDPEGIVKQARKIIDEYSFKAIKLKGGAFPPAQEVAAIKALSEAFPGVPLRLDPNAAWTVETSKWVARELEGIVEYLEDPAGEIEGMAAVAKEASAHAVLGKRDAPEPAAVDVRNAVVAREPLVDERVRRA